MLRALVLSLLMFIGTSVVAACIDKSVKCNTATYGWQGQCFKNLSCSKCGPSHCAKTPTLTTSKSKALRDGANAQSCRDDLVKRKTRAMGRSACSIPSQVSGAFGMADLVFGKSACLEHDVCYAMDGMNKKICDTMFLDNLRRSCKSYYYGHVGDRGWLKTKNTPGYASCKAAARLFYFAVDRFADGSFNPSSVEKALCTNTQGPPKLDTNLYLTGIGTNDRIKLKSKKNGSDKSGKVKVCLRNKTNQWKGMHFKKSSSAKYVTKKNNNVSCGHYKPGVKSFYFWEKRLPAFKKRVNGSAIKLDLTGYANYRINLDWYEGK